MIKIIDVHKSYGELKVLYGIDLEVNKGEVGIIRSNDDTEGELVKFKEGEQVRLAQGERHRLIGLEDYGIVAEIWQHTDSVPSDEEDIVSVQDDFKRN